MKKVKLFLFNYGTITQIADFKKAGHDAIKCLHAMNDRQVKAHSELSEKVFYFVEWYGEKTNNKHISVECSNNRYDILESKIKLIQFKTQELFTV
jgi:hypothetical protein